MKKIVLTGGGTAGHVTPNIALMPELKKRGYQSVHFLVNKENKKALRSYAVFQFPVVGECEMFGQPFFCYESKLQETGQKRRDSEMEWERGDLKVMTPEREATWKCIEDRRYGVERSKQKTDVQGKKNSE